MLRQWILNNEVNVCFVYEFVNFLLLERICQKEEINSHNEYNKQYLFGYLVTRTARGILFYDSITNNRIDRQFYFSIPS